MGQTGIRVTFFRTAIKPAGTLSLVEYEDGSLGIVRDDQPIEGCRWEPGKLDQSIQAYRDLNARLQVIESYKPR